MGKYSLDAFEAHPLVKLRPVMTEPDLSGYRLLELRRSELEPESGMLLPPPEIGEGRVLLRLQLNAADDISDACGFIRRMGSCYHGGTALAGVVMTAGAFSGTALIQLAWAYRQGFASTVLLAEPDAELMDICRREGIQTGLWLPIVRGILPLRRAIGEKKLQRVWRETPVYLWTGGPLASEELDAARRWHVSGANVPAPLGARMTLRRMMFPRDLTSGDIMPLRMWWQNIGTAPVYEDVRVRLVLRNGTEAFAVSVPGTMSPGLGDTTFNTTALLPQVPCGTYGLWVGLETDRGSLTLAMDAPAEDGLYHIGEITLDDVPRPYLRTMWEDQYADGYYPLEDPAQPG